MAFPVVESTSSGEVSSNSTSHAITMPSGVTAGDVIVVFLSIDGSNTVAINTGVSGNNWALSQYGGGNAQIAVAWKVAEGSDALTFTTSSEQSTWTAYRISGASVVEVSAGALAFTSNANPPNLALSSSQDALWLAAAGWDGIVTASAAPTDFSNLITGTATNSAGASIATARRFLTASSLNPGTFTSANARWHTFTVAAYQGAIADVLAGDGAGAQASAASASVEVAAQVEGGGASAQAAAGSGALALAARIDADGAAGVASAADAVLLHGADGAYVLTGEAAMAIATGADAQLTDSAVVQPALPQIVSGGRGPFIPYTPAKPRLLRRVRLAGKGAAILATGGAAQLRAARLMSAQSARAKGGRSDACLRRGLVLRGESDSNYLIRHAQAADEAWLLAA